MDINKGIEERLAALGTSIPEILLPGPGIDLEKWAVIACDQFTQDRHYWDKVKEIIGDAPSALNLILPEISLNDGDLPERRRQIRRSMTAYLADKTFAPPLRCCVYLERATPFHPCRRGLILAVDLDHYDWAPEARPLIRATEGTVPERLPPRMEIRRGAPLESPHILLLIDDREDALLPALGDQAKRAAPLYRTPLMLGGGSVSGWALDTEAGWKLLAEDLEALAHQSPTRYPQPFLYAVGDGNHSLASAKAVWDEYKAAHSGDPGLAAHPARWALAELENLYDPGIVFEPIHRVVFGTNSETILALLAALPDFERRPVRDRADLSRLVGDPAAPKSRLGLIAGSTFFLVETSAPPVITESLQPLLDNFARSHTEASIDYIHGEDEVFRLATSGPASLGRTLDSKSTIPVGILLPPVRKSGLFETVARSGPLPRKSFSMGEAPEKRFYLECRGLFG